MFNALVIGTCENISVSQLTVHTIANDSWSPWTAKPLDFRIDLNLISCMLKRKKKEGAVKEQCDDKSLGRGPSGI